MANKHIFLTPIEIRRRVCRNKRTVNNEHMWNIIKIVLFVSEDGSLTFLWVFLQLSGKSVI